MTEIMASAGVPRDEIVRAARRWLRTPYHHQAAERGVGVDCLGLVRGVYGEIVGRDPAAPPAYTRDWAEALGQDTLMDAAHCHLVPAAYDAPRAGDVLVFRYRSDLPAKHVGIVTTAATFIHAVERRGVLEATLVPWWTRRIVGVFCLPGVLD